MTIWTRWPVSTSILPIRSRIFGRDAVAGGLGVAGQRLREQADGRQRRPQLVREVVDELGPDLLEAAQLRDVLEDDPDAADRRPPRPDDEDRPVGTAQRNSPDARARLAGLSTSASTRASTNASSADRPRASPAAGRAGCGRRRSRARRAAVVQPNDPDAHEVGQVRGVADLLVELELGGIEPVSRQLADVGRSRSPAASRGRARVELADALELGSAVEAPARWRARAGSPEPDEER